MKKPNSKKFVAPLMNINVRIRAGDVDPPKSMNAENTVTGKRSFNKVVFRVEPAYHEISDYWKKKVLIGLKDMVEQELENLEKS